MDEFDKRIIDIVETYKKKQVEDGDNHPTLPALFKSCDDIESFAESVTSPESQIMSEAIIKEYNADDVVDSKHRNRGNFKIESKEHIKIIEDMVAQSLFQFDCLWSHLKDGHSLHDVAEKLEECLQEMRTPNNAIFLQEETLCLTLMEETINLCKSKSNEPDKKTKFLAREVVSLVIKAFQSTGMEITHARQHDRRPSTPFAVFEVICKKHFENYLVQHAEPFQMDYQNLDGWNEAIKQLKPSSRKKKS